MRFPSADRIAKAVRSPSLSLRPFRAASALMDLSIPFAGLASNVRFIAFHDPG